MSGNASVVIASESRPLPAVTLSEVLATSDVPGGVVNLITGLRRELVQHLAAHMDVNGLDAYGLDPAQAAAIEDSAWRTSSAWCARPQRAATRSTGERTQPSPYHIGEFVEIKTVWHPIGA